MIARALFYADRCSLLNAVRSLARRPGRVLLWCFYAAAIASFAVLKILQSGHSPRRTIALGELTLADLWVAALVAMLGSALAFGSTARLGLFASRAEAFFTVRAHDAPWTVAAYLQLRAIVVSLAVVAARFAYVVVIGIPGVRSAGGLVAQLAFVAAGGAAIVAVLLPRALARGPARIASLALGWILIAGAVLCFVLDGAHAMRLDAAVPALHALPVAHPGLLLVALGNGDLRAFVLPLAIAAAASATFVVAARDAYPELYEISVAGLEQRSRRRRARIHAVSATSSSAEAASRFPGALAFVWIDALAFARRVSPAATAFVAALALAAGGAFALFARAFDPAFAFTMLFTIAPVTYFTLASGTAVRLASELRRPLFWLGDVPLALRLALWALAPVWRDGVLLLLAVVGIAPFGPALVPLALAAAVAGVALSALTRAIGLAVFALLPSALDQRGPAILVRTLLAMLFLVPPALAGAIGGGIAGSGMAAGVSAATIVALLEIPPLVGFAALRLAGGIDRLDAST